MNCLRGKVSHALIGGSHEIIGSCGDTLVDGDLVVKRPKHSADSPLVGDARQAYRESPLVAQAKVWCHISAVCEGFKLLGELLAERPVLQESTIYNIGVL